MAVKSQLLLVLIVDSGGFSWSSDIRGSKKEISVSGRGVPRAESTSPGSVSSVSSYEFRLMLSGSWGKFHTPSSSSSPFLNALINGLYIFFISPDQVKIQMYNFIKPNSYPLRIIQRSNTKFCQLSTYCSDLSVIPSLEGGLSTSSLAFWLVGVDGDPSFDPIALSSARISSLDGFRTSPDAPVFTSLEAYNSIISCSTEEWKLLI